MLIRSFPPEKQLLNPTNYNIHWKGGRRKSQNKTNTYKVFNSTSLTATAAMYIYISVFYGWFFFKH